MKDDDLWIVTWRGKRRKEIVEEKGSIEVFGQKKAFELADKKRKEFKEVSIRRPNKLIAITELSQSQERKRKSQCVRSSPFFLRFRR